MHNRRLIYRIHRPGPVLAAVLFVCAALLSAACLPRERDDIPLTDLTEGRPKLKEVRGAQVYFLLQEDGNVVALWGISPLSPVDGNTVRCFIQDRVDRAFRGETHPFIDPCRGAWWSRDGRFLGFSTDPEGAPSDGPSLVRIPVEIRDGRAAVDQTRLDCLQSRTCQ
jgi:hypothetical protein